MGLSHQSWPAHFCTFPPLKHNKIKCCVFQPLLTGIFLNFLFYSTISNMGSRARRLRVWVLEQTTGLTPSSACRQLGDSGTLA